MLKKEKERAYPSQFLLTFKQLIMELSLLPCAKPGEKINVYETLIMKEEATELQQHYTLRVLSIEPTINFR